MLGIYPPRTKYLVASIIALLPLVCMNGCSREEKAEISVPVVQTPTAAERYRQEFTKLPEAGVRIDDGTFRIARADSDTFRRTVDDLSGRIRADQGLSDTGNPSERQALLSELNNHAQQASPEALAGVINSQTERQLLDLFQANGAAALHMSGVSGAIVGLKGMETLARFTTAEGNDALMKTIAESVFVNAARTP
jgi:hypothetical protein